MALLGIRRLNVRRLSLSVIPAADQLELTLDPRSPSSIFGAAQALKRSRLKVQCEPVSSPSTASEGTRETRGPRTAEPMTSLVPCAQIM
ncbi:hypothetical protein GJ744_007018 [Endocarpon pusillum]|uniref:Uncharacterized protein n=1 Tax=Endocarpon pusillum TaxID=364733 RepID=A0A8H7AL28_9EURO|nr:hypothetical protein GJ744_007018 [Endocarpon pusillum]